VILRRARTRFERDVAAAPAEVEKHLRASVAVVRSILFSPTWGRGEDFLATIRGTRIEMRARHGYSNGLTRIFYGSITPTPKGSRIEGEFRTLLWVVLILRVVWLFFLGAALAGREPALFGAIMILVLAGIETIARRMGDADEEKMRGFLSRLAG
jgi:hypothetical protein